MAAGVRGRCTHCSCDKFTAHARSRRRSRQEGAPVIVANRRSYFPSSSNQRNLVGRAKLRAERDAAQKRLEDLERREDVRRVQAAKQEQAKGKLRSFLERTKRFLTQPIRLGRTA